MYLVLGSVVDEVIVLSVVRALGVVDVVIVLGVVSLVGVFTVKPFSRCS